MTKVLNSRTYNTINELLKGKIATCKKVITSLLKGNLFCLTLLSITRIE